ncbi:MAG: hypothetical protein CMP59_10500 [Flavobacteriales bacterium]|nr:hypothetical protein [Flavobacteriales bacterium]
MILIYLAKTNPRNRYIFKVVLGHYFGLEEFKLVDDEKEYLAYEGPKFSYSSKRIDDGIHFHASGLLDQRGIKKQEIEFGEHQGVPTLFHHKEDASIPYDPFSASFFMLTRYEEYLPYLSDQYDRFNAEDSLAKERGFLQTAVVDRWLIQIRELLKSKYPNLSFKKYQYRYLLTLDIDNAYAYKEKGLVRNIGAFIRNLINTDFQEIKLQIQVLLRKKNDPFDSYNYLKNIQKRYNLRPIYFFLLADYGLNDKNIFYQNRHFQSLIKSIADYAEVGIHPSFGSNYKHNKLGDEINRLERITKRDIHKSRQHFLKLHLPDTYRRLVEADIHDDYTMGYASELGFRAGAAFAYPFYDLNEEVELKLMVNPFMVMDATLKYYLKVEGEKAFDQIKPIIDECKAVNGIFASLWHNESLGESKEWEGWRELFEKMNDYATENGQSM